jgi:hypothetical protein
MKMWDLEGVSLSLFECKNQRCFEETGEDQETFHDSNYAILAGIQT